MRSIAFLFLALSLSGCATGGLSQTDFDRRNAVVFIGMPKEEFRKAFPEASGRSAKRYPAGTVEVLEVGVEEYHFVPTGRHKRSPLTGMESVPKWFYFYNGKLVQYGEPNDWPEKPDNILEIRNR